MITIYQDRSLHLRDEDSRRCLFFLKKAAGIQIGKKPASGSKTPGKPGSNVGKVSEAQLREIAEKKMPDLNCDSVDAAVAMIRGSARAMGLEVTA